MMDLITVSMMKSQKLAKKFSALMLGALVLVGMGGAALAQPADTNTEISPNKPLFTEADNLGVELGFINTEEGFAAQLGTFINYLLTLLGLITLLYFLYGGVLMLTSQGNEEKVGDARKIMMYAIIGVIIIALAFAINAWIFSSDFFQGNNPVS